MLGDGSTIGEMWRRLALPVAVAVAAGHMTKGLAKFVSWAGFLPVAMTDPVGTETIRAMSNRTMVQPILLLPLAVVAVLGIVLILGGLVFAIREARLAHPNRAPHVSYLIPKISLALAFVLVVVGWAFK